MLSLQDGKARKLHYYNTTDQAKVSSLQIFNRVDYALAAAETFYELKSSKIWIDYEKVWEEFVEMANAGEYAKIVQVWNGNSKSFEERWDAFKSGAQFVPKTKEIEDYFYEENYKKEFYKKVNAYIEQKLGKLIEIEVPKEKQKEIIKKKDAIPHFTAYLKEVYNQDTEKEDYGVI